MGASTQAKSFMQMEKELRAKIDGMSDDEKSKAFFKAMVAQDADQIRRLLAALVDTAAVNTKGQTAMDVCKDRDKTKSLEVFEETTERLDRKSRKGPAGLSLEEKLERLDLKLSSKIEQELIGVFQQFDRDGDGTIDIDELSTVMLSLGQELNDRELQKMMNEMDLDGTGSVEFEEFALVMSKRMKAALMLRGVG